VAAAEEGPGRERRLDSGEGGEAWATLLQDPRWRGLAVCEAGARFGFAAKVASVPVLAASVLPGGAVAAGSLLSAAGLAGLAGAPLGGWLTDRAGARATAAASAAGAGAALLLVPLVLAAPAGGAEGFGGASASGIGFCGLVLLWSVAVAAEGPALVAVGQELAPPGSEALALALPRAVGDAVYIIAPFLLGTVADASPGLGVECAVAGAASLVGAAALAAFGGSSAGDDDG